MSGDHFSPHGLHTRELRGSHILERATSLPAITELLESGYDGNDFSIFLNQYSTRIPFS
jgi:hypothetical protein